MKNNNNDKMNLAAEILRTERRNTGETSLKRFTRIYLEHYLKQDFSPMHDWMFEQLETMTLKDRGKHLAIAAPRGHAKSTIASLALVLWYICLVGTTYGYLEIVNPVDMRGKLALMLSILSPF